MRPRHPERLTGTRPPATGAAENRTYRSGRWTRLRRGAPGAQARADAFCAGTRRIEADLLRDIFGNPFRPVAFDPSWRTDTVVTLAKQMYESREFGATPILADALQDAGCDDEDVLAPGRNEGPHVRGCWVIDLVLGRA